MLNSRESDFFLADWRIRPQLNVLESSDGQEISVEARSMEVLVCLARHQGKVVRKERLIGEVWVETFVTDDALTHAIWELRKALGDDPKKPRFIQTVPRRGYRLLGRVNRLEAPPSADVQMIGPYRVGEKLGGGAMGVVHRAEDTRLRRPVALKFLAPELVRDPEAQARFLREARAASSLDHPGICTIHDIGETGEGGLYLAMAYYEGETLKRRLARGPLPPEEALEVAAQIAEALAAAHAKGIVHRDLKPANVMLTSEGRAMLLDFGLAKLVDRSQLTRAGRPLGTPAYMAPEQARGEAIDHRVDLWALGVVLYQMLSGKLPFGGENSNAVLYTITHEEPLPLEAAAELPSGVTALLERLLRKEPDRRYADSAALSEALRGTPIPELATVPAPPEERRRPKSMPTWVATGVVVVVVAVVAVASWLVVNRNQGASLGPPTFTPFTTDGGWKDTPRLSPDGERVAYAWRGPTDDLDIYVKALGLGAEPLRLTDDPGEEWSPVWSPDGRQIAFARSREEGVALFLVPSLGGPERKLADVELDSFEPGINLPLPSLSWLPDGRLVFAERTSEQEPYRIVSLSPETREKRFLTSPPHHSGGDSHPAFSPDGTRLAFVRLGAAVWGNADIWVQPAEGGEARQLTSGSYDYVAGLSWTPRGDEIIFTTYPHGRMFRVDAAGGEPRPVTGTGDGAAFATIAGQWMVHQQVKDRGTMNIWRIPGRGTPASDRTPEKLIASSAIDGSPSYSPDGRKIAFASSRTGTNIWLCNSDGSDPVQLTDFESSTGTPRWSPDGQSIVFDSLEPGNWDLYIVDSEGGLPRQLTHEESDDGTGTFSRDGRWIYFHSDRGGSVEIWKISPEGGEAVQVTRGGGFYPEESWDGRYLYYARSHTETGIWRVPVAGGEETEILPGPIDGWTDWALSRSGIYFHDRDRSNQRVTIHFFDFESRETTELFRKEGAFEYQGIAVSPDEESILYAEYPRWVAELTLVEDFR